MTQRWLKLGIVGRAHGLKGSFFVSGRDEEVAESVRTIRIGVDATTAKDLKIEQRFWQSGRPALKCEGISDRTTAETLTGQSVWVEAAQIHVDESKEYLLSDLKERRVVDSNGVPVGVVEEVYVSPSGGVNIIVLDEKKNADIEIPMVETYINMNFKRGEAVLHLVVPVDTFEEIWNERRAKK